MTFDLWFGYVGTVLVLMSAPGPSHLLMISNSIANGFSRSLATAAGDLSANTGQMLLAGLGVASLVAAVPASLLILQALGIGYLVWLGAARIRQASRPHSGYAVRKGVGLRALWLQGFITSAVNPKAVVFFAALFPQFIRPEMAFWPQLSILGGTYLVLDGAFLLTYGALAAAIARRLTVHSWPLIERISGALLIATALYLALKAAG